MPDNSINYSIIHWGSYLTKERQIELTNWYAGLSAEDRQNVDDIRFEGCQEGAWEGTDIGENY